MVKSPFPTLEFGYTYLKWRSPTVASRSFIFVAIVGNDTQSPTVYKYAVTHHNDPTVLDRVFRCVQLCAVQFAQLNTFYLEFCYHRGAIQRSDWHPCRGVRVSNPCVRRGDTHYPFSSCLDSTCGKFAIVGHSLWLSSITLHLWSWMIVCRGKWYRWPLVVYLVCTCLFRFVAH